MKTIKIIVIAFMALAISSCSQSKEDKFLADLEDFVEKFENSSYDYLKDNFESMSKTFFSKVENLYGVDLAKSDHIMECMEASGLDLNEKQKEKAYELEERLLKRFADLKEGKEDDEKNRNSTLRIEAIHQAAHINDPDGYTNVRSMPDGKAKIVAKIVDGEEFYFDKVPGSNWVKVYRSADTTADCIGYMHSSRVMPVGGTNSNELSYESDDSDNYEVSSTGSENWDALLKSYEEYVDKYISYLKKASKGDMTALSEYPALMRKAQEFNDKMKSAKSDMSVSQWARYNEITMKMLDAAKEMDD